MRTSAFIHHDPAYTATEAARILGLPPATLKAWSFGQASGGGRRFQPVIKPADKAARLLSFANLCELHVLSAIRRNHKIPLPKVRASLEYVQKRLGSDRPLLDRDFKTNGIDLFVQHASKLLNVSQQGRRVRAGVRQCFGRRYGPARGRSLSEDPTQGQGRKATRHVLRNAGRRHQSGAVAGRLVSR